MPPANDRAPAAPNLRRGLRGSLDLPVGAVDRPSGVTVAGWAFHEEATILLVLVTVDGRVAGTAQRTTERPDVAQAHASVADAAVAGWDVQVDLGRPPAGRVTIAAHALVSTGERPGQQARTVLLPFAERTVDLAPDHFAEGQVHVPDSVVPGPLRVTGIADVEPALARVELSLDGRAGHTVRHSLPSDPSGAEDPERRVLGFAGFVDVPEDVSEVTVEAIAVATDGRRRRLPPQTVPVRPTTRDPLWTQQRREVLAERFQRHVEALRPDVPGPARVLVVTHDLGVGGAQNYLDDLMAALHRSGVELCVVSGASGSLLERVEERYGAPVLVVGPPPLTAEALAARVRLIAGFAAEHGAVACLANTLVSFPGVLAAEEMGLPSIWAIHESFHPAVFWQEYLGRSPAPEMLEATVEALRVCDDVVFEAAATRRLYGSLVSEETASLVPYGLDPATMDRAAAGMDRAAARRELGLDPDARVLVCVGTMEARKGQLALVRAFSRLDPRTRDGAVLCLVGASDDPYSLAVRDFAATTLGDHVRVEPADPDILRWYLAADALVSASDVESMPRTMLEAMFLDRPVAATAAYGVPELVDDGATGWLCPPGDLGELTALLERVLRTPREEAAAMGRAAGRTVRDGHDARGYVAHVEDRLKTWMAAARAAQGEGEQ